MLAVALAAATIVVLTGSHGRVRDHDLHSEHPEVPLQEHPQEQLAAMVDGKPFYREDLELMGGDPDIALQWVEDELLARMAAERGLENARKSRLVQDRARQLYLRDRMLFSVYEGIEFPDSSDVFRFMMQDSAAYLTERHYFQIILADESMADSVHQRLSWGENFQITAERLSIGQKAGIGGDLGFLTPGELIAYGIPREAALSQGLLSPVRTPYGWHILMVDESRPLEDTARAVRSIGDDIYRMRLEAARDSLLEAAAEGIEVYVAPDLASGDTGSLEEAQ